MEKKGGSRASRRDHNHKKGYEVHIGKLNSSATEHHVLTYNCHVGSPLNGLEIGLIRRHFTPEGRRSVEVDRLEPHTTAIGL